MRIQIFPNYIVMLVSEHNFSVRLLHPRVMKLFTVLNKVETTAKKSLQKSHQYLKNNLILTLSDVFGFRGHA